MNKWNKNKCSNEAKKFKKRSEFKKKSPAAYREACRNNWLESITAHMPTPRRYKIGDAVRLAKKRQGLCLSKELINVHQKLIWSCKKKHRWVATFSSVSRQNTWCKKCFFENQKIESNRLLSRKLSDFYKLYARVPRKREFDIFCKKKLSPTATSHFGSWNNFIKNMGYLPRSRSMGSVWFGWENLCYKIILDLYPDNKVIRQFKYAKMRTIDFYLPELGLGIDAKTSNYRTDSLDKQSRRYLASKEFKRIEFWCLYKTNEPLINGINYLFKEDISRLVKSKKLRQYLDNENKLAKKFGIISKKELIQQILHASAKLGRAPKMNEFNSMRGYHDGQSVRRLFGSWHQGLYEAGITPHSRTHLKLMTEKQIRSYFIFAIRKYISEFKRVPNLTEYRIFSKKNNYIWIETIKKFYNLKRYTEVLELFKIKYDFSRVKPKISYEKYLNKLCDLNLEPLDEIDGMYSYDSINYRCFCCEHKNKVKIIKLNSLKGCLNCIKLNQNATSRLSEADLKLQALKNNFILISDYSEYINMQSILLYQCRQCQRIDRYRCSSIKNHQHCKSCRTNLYLNIK